MKVRLVTVDAELHALLKANHKSHRKYRETVSYTLPGSVDLTGRVVELLGKARFVVEQYPALKTRNQKGRKK